MKKNILKLVFASVSALVGGYSVYASQQKVGHLAVIQFGRNS